ncbi:MAG: caspase family protein [Chromatiales bacterium]|nr:caspase family protein [Chromatiales bacterium]
MPTLSRALPVNPLVTLLLSFLIAFSALADQRKSVSGLKLPDGALYQGETLNGLLHGSGRLAWSNGDKYEGQFKDGFMHGDGVMQYASGDRYKGEFKLGYQTGLGRWDGPVGQYYVGEFLQSYFDGKGELHYEDGSSYKGDFKLGKLHGLGVLKDEYGNTYSGEFVNDKFTGQGKLRDVEGNTYTGGFKNWEFSGAGEYVTVAGDTYRGAFVDGVLTGKGTHLRSNGDRYEGEMQNWSYHGKGEMFYKSGDHYSGGFEYGAPNGEGVMTYKEPRDGVSRLSGEWDYGQFVPARKKRRAETAKVVESVLYNQNDLLQTQFENIASGANESIDMYFLGVGGYGRQDVFRKEVDTIKALFDEHFGTQYRALRLINNKGTSDQYPLATLTSIKQALQQLEQKMNVEEDILFLYLTSHGSKEHELALTMNGLTLANLSAEGLAGMLNKTSIKWKVVVVSACYSGGFVEPLKGENTLVMTASAKDKKSFGCSDENEMTDFAKAYFQKALPNAGSFEEAFEVATALIEEDEKEQKIKEHSRPQIAMGSEIRQHLKSWRLGIESQLTQQASLSH